MLYQRLGKRLIDVAAGIVGLTLASPIILLCCLAIRLDSKGPSVFRQTRLGLRQRPFVCLKLRTMFIETPEAASHQIGASAITPVGRFLRRTKLDELPQLLNVVKGELSLVGPRPCLPSQHELIQLRQERGVFLIKPGITGLAQVRGVDMSNPDRLSKLDAEYLNSISLSNDISILLQTLSGTALTDRAGK
jgi:O-antigen biosynthesis protein WbqP